MMYATHEIAAAWVIGGALICCHGRAIYKPIGFIIMIIATLAAFA